MNLYRRSGKIILFVLTLGFSFASALPSAHALEMESGAATVRIGALLDLSGPFSSYGTVAYKSIRLAVERINAQGGIQGRSVEILVFDTTADENRLLEGASQLKDQGVVALIGPSAAKNTILLRRFAETHKIPLMLINGTSPILTFSGIKTRWTFSSTLNFSSELKALFSVFKKRGYQNLGVLVQVDDFFKELFLWIRGYAPEYGLMLGCAEGFNPNPSDIGRKIGYMNRCGPDVALVWGNGNVRGTIREALGSIEVPVALSHRLYGGPVFWSANATNLLMFVAIPRSLAPAGLKRFLSVQARNFLDSWGSEMDAMEFMLQLDAAQAWDGIMILAKAMKAGGLKGRSQLRYALEHSIKGYDGALGRISYDKRDHSLLTPDSLEVLRFFRGRWGFAR